jgi:hypothetical protein
MIWLYYTLCSFYAHINNISVPTRFDLGPLELYDHESCVDFPVTGKNEERIVVFHYLKDQVSKYLLMKLIKKGNNGLGILYDNMSKTSTYMDKEVKSKVLAYLRFNRFVASICRQTSVLWPVRNGRRGDPQGANNPLPKLFKV